jgi:hypothetical protein
MKIIDIYGKEYTCSKCDAKVNYGSVDDGSGKALTKDGKPFNQIFGKGSNKISVAVNTGTTEAHPCYAKLVAKQIAEVARPPPKEEPKTVENDVWVTDPMGEFEILVKKAYDRLFIIAGRFCEEGASVKEKHITTMGLMHDYFAFRASKKL